MKLLKHLNIRNCKLELLEAIEEGVIYRESKASIFETVFFKGEIRARGC